MQATHLDRFRDDTRFTGVRQTGTITAMELKTADGGYLAKIGPALQSYFRDAREDCMQQPWGSTMHRDAKIEGSCAALRGSIDGVGSAVLQPVGLLSFAATLRKPHQACLDGT